MVTRLTVAVIVAVTVVNPVGQMSVYVVTIVVVCIAGDGREP